MPREFSHSQLSLQDFSDRGKGSKEVLRNCLRSDKWMRSEKFVSLWTQARGWSTGPWKVCAGEIAAVELLEPDFDLGPPGSIVAECAR
jgi:hypothetical protein